MWLACVGRLTEQEGAEAVGEDAAGHTPLPRVERLLLLERQRPRLWTWKGRARGGARRVARKAGADEVREGDEARSREAREQRPSKHASARLGRGAQRRKRQTRRGRGALRTVVGEAAEGGGQAAPSGVVEDTAAIAARNSGSKRNAHAA